MFKRKYIFNIRDKIYFIPGYFSIIAFFISIIVIILDYKFANILYEYIPSYFFTSSDLAETILSTLAGSLFGMITVSFSTIMIVLTMYSAQFSPRIVQDFLQNRITLKVLGIFVGGFIYSILTLLFLKQGPEKNIVFSAVLGVVIGIVCLTFFVYFIHHVANSVQVNKLIENLRDEIIEIVDNIEERTASNDQIKNIPPDNIDEMLGLEGKPVYADDHGYIKFVYDIELTKMAQNNNILIKAEKTIGDYVTENSQIFSIRKLENDENEENEENDENNENEKNDNKNKDDENENKDHEANNEFELENIEEIKEKLLNHVVIDNERNKKSDIEFGLLKLTEVALKAISPGINDPNTAVFCINQLGWVLSRIAVSNIESTYYYDEEDQIRFITEDVSFGDLLYKTFYQLRHYGKEDVSVAASILDALLIIAEGSPDEIKQEVWEFSDYILSGFEEEVLDTEDKRFLNNKIYSLAVETNNEEDTESFFEVEK